MEVLYAIMFILGIGMVIGGFALIDEIYEGWKIAFCVFVILAGGFCVVFSTVKMCNINKKEQNDNNKFVLELLADDKITAEEAETLLNK